MKNTLKKLILICLFIYVGDALAQKTGVLVMAHGGGEEWNNYVKEAAMPLSDHYEVEFAWGMANPVTLQQGVNSLEKKGVSEIIAIPLFISSYSPIIRQTEYLFGMRDSMVDRPMPVMHHADHYIKMFNVEVDSSKFRHGMYFPDELPRISKEADITMTEALDSHDVVAEILGERIHAMSENPSTETVIIAAHGPNSEEDNAMWVETMEELIQKIQTNEEKDGGEKFKQMFGVTVRDDASETVHDQAKAQLRTLVRQSGMNGDVIVVPLFLSSGGREQAVAERLEGLDFKWSGETLLPHSKLTDFLMNSAEKADETKNGKNQASIE
ncbi:sirohydrochlorin chelatase [Rhodohalobacter sp. 614A]|uniref:sirohydrochlorin chelatase n=1 Tax=Rhodohalobacter sp. 614A TaxID=2908649 RepID=UPI001F3A9EB3|nr:hypothetical protein [Rhodohalobacter sp. 614A]